MRILKHHEKKLLKKTNFLEWKRDKNSREVRILNKYGIEDREEYHKYNKICGLITKLVSELKTVASDDEMRTKMTEQLCNKLIAMGIINKDHGLSELAQLSASSFCRRRLSTVLVKLHFAQNIEHAISIIQGGHICIGPDLITAPSLLVTREMEDHLSWAEGSSMKRKIREFRNETDDYELLGN